MIKVRVRFDLAKTFKTQRIEGVALRYPEIGRDWAVSTPCGPDFVQIDFGTVLNIKPFKDMFLIQTELIVAEVWILEDDSPVMNQLQ